MEFLRNINKYPIVLEFKTKEKEVESWQIIAEDEKWQGSSREDFIETLEYFNTEILTERRRMIIHCYDLAMPYYFCKEYFTSAIDCTETKYENDVPCEWTRFVDYKKIKFTEMRQLANISDPKEMREYLNELRLKTYHKSMDEIAYTQAGIIKKELSKILLSTRDWINFDKRLRLDDRTYFLYYHTFSGGDVFAPIHSRDTVIEIDSYDRTSAYPYELYTREFPFTGALMVANPTEEKMKEIQENYLYGVHIIAKNVALKRNMVPTIKYCNLISCQKPFIHDKDRLLRCPQIELVLLKPDYELFLKHYNVQEIEIKIIFYHKIKRKLQQEFRDYIIEKFKIKNECEKGTSEYRDSKTAINTLAGLFQQDPIKYSGSLKAHYTDKRQKKFFMPYVVGCWLLAYARENLYKLIDSVGINAAYWDTDCVKMENGELFEDIVEKLNNEMRIPDDPYGLGLWKYEGHFDFKALKAKVYFIKDEDGLESAVVAGLDMNSAMEYIKKDIGSVLNIEFGYTIPAGKSDFKVCETGENWRILKPSDYTFNAVGDEQILYIIEKYKKENENNDI